MTGSANESYPLNFYLRPWPVFNLTSQKTDKSRVKGVKTTFTTNFSVKAKDQFPAIPHVLRKAWRFFVFIILGHPQWLSSLWNDLINFFGLNNLVIFHLLKIHNESKIHRLPIRPTQSSGNLSSRIMSNYQEPLIDMKDCKDLALQLFEHDDIDVIMGGGRDFFVDRLDGRNLIQAIIWFALFERRNLCYFRFLIIIYGISFFRLKLILKFEIQISRNVENLFFHYHNYYENYHTVDSVNGQFLNHYLFRNGKMMATWLWWKLNQNYEKRWTIWL